VLSKGLTQAFWIPYQISSTSLIAYLSPDTYTVVEIFLINSKDDISDRLGLCWLQLLNVVRLLSVANLKGTDFSLFFSHSSRQLLNVGKDKAE